MKERPFFAGDGIFTILADPGVPSDAAVIVLNSGLLHRVGAGRFNVDLCRLLAARGLPAARYDASGIGDSEARADGLMFEESAPLETSQVMDKVAALTGAARFALVGLCSGADAAFWTALKDDRVTALVQLDPFVYPTWRYHMVKIAPRVLDGGAWVRLLKRQFARRQAAEADGSAAAGEGVFISPYVRAFPPRDTVAAGLRALVARRVRLYNVFSGGLHEVNHQRQYRDCFADVPFGDLLQVEHCPAADHVFTQVAERRAVLERIGAWITGALGAPAAPAAAERPSLQPVG